jgi:hypothetical protein
LTFTDPDAGQNTTDQVRREAGGYCGQVSGLTACTFSAPALVTYAGIEADAGQVQRPVGENLFAEAGAGGTGEGTGAYNVPVPEATAEDQVRYLVDILTSSAQTRADLGPVLEDLNHRIAGEAQIAKLTSIADNRHSLIEALESTPVSEVPDGVDLVAMLREALVVSEQADRLYVRWAEILRDGGDDKAIVDEWRPIAAHSEKLKKSFLKKWNTAIATAYDAPQFEADRI